MLTFDEGAHAYHWSGIRVPNVTSILSPLTNYDAVPAAALEAARQKGQAVHKMVELWALDELDAAQLPEWMFPVLDYWLKFTGDTQLKVIDSEKRVYHGAYGYAGTLDLLCTINGRKGLGVLDLKRSFMGGKAIALQTAAYARAEEYESKKQIEWRAALRLREDMPPRMQFYEDKADFGVFLALLAIDTWKRKNA